MNLLKQNFIYQKREVERKELEKIKTRKKLETFFFPLLVSALFYAIAITILYRKQKITWSDTGSLVLEKWAYISLSVITGLVSLFFCFSLLGEFTYWSELFINLAYETEELAEEVKKTNPEILERLEKEAKEKNNIIN